MSSRFNRAVKHEIDFLFIKRQNVPLVFYMMHRGRICSMDATRFLKVCCAIWCLAQGPFKSCKFYGSDLFVQDVPQTLDQIKSWGIRRPRQHLELFCHVPKTIPEPFCSATECIILLKDATVIREHRYHEEVNLPGIPGPDVSQPNIALSITVPLGVSRLPIVHPEAISSTAYQEHTTRAAVSEVLCLSRLAIPICPMLKSIRSLYTHPYFQIPTHQLLLKLIKVQRRCNVYKLVSRSTRSNRHYDARFTCALNSKAFNNKRLQ